MTKKQKGFTVIEIIVALAITTLFIAVFVQLALPISLKINRGVKDLETYQHLLFVTAFLDNMAQFEDFKIDIATSSLGIKVSARNILCNISNQENFKNMFVCSFARELKAEKKYPLLNLLDYGTTTLSFEIDEKSSQYQMYIGKYIAQFGLFPHVFLISSLIH